MTNTARNILTWTFWPVMMLAAVTVMAAGFAHDLPVLTFNLIYLTMFALLIWLEWAMPHEQEWRRPDGQIFADIAHTISSKGTVQTLLLFGGVIGLTEYIQPLAEPVEYGIWPRSWPIWAQVVLAVYAAEFMLYWAHRLSHETAVLWRFHAVHHSVTRLWTVNTGRFHFMDSLWKIVLSLTPLVLLGAPMEVVQWLSAITAFFGVLTHCNVAMKGGWLSYIFNTPEVHRWHHSKVLSEGNRNYGENVVLWDQVFSTYINPDRRPPVNIGITDYMPEKFSYQIIWPFLTNTMRKKLVPHYVPKAFVREQKLSSPQ